jgi:1-acylglycerone phosphate reductase
MRTHQVSAAVEAVIQKSGRIDVLVSNAGVPCVGPLAEVDLGTARAAFETNVVGLLAVVQVGGRAHVCT